MALISNLKKQLSDGFVWGLLTLIFSIIFIVVHSIYEPSNGLLPSSEASFSHRVSGRGLFVVVDSDGVLIGDQLLSFESAEIEIPRIIESESLNVLVVYGSDRAKLGDIVRIYGCGDRKRIPSRFLSDIPIPRDSTLVSRSYVHSNDCIGTGNVIPMFVERSKL